MYSIPTSPEQSSPRESVGVGILALDPTLAPLLERVADMTVEVLPDWIDCETFEEDRGVEPMSVIAYGTGELPRSAWRELMLSLQWISWNHHTLRFLACGNPEHRVGLEIPRLQHFTAVSDPAVVKALRDQPICVVAYSFGRPPWINELLAKGCAVIAVAAGPERSDSDSEYREGVIRVPGEGRVIAQTIDSLLIDPVRLTALKSLGGAYVRSLPRPIETARALLRKYVAACAGSQSA